MNEKTLKLKEIRKNVKRRDEVSDVVKGKRSTVCTHIIIIK